MIPYNCIRHHNVAVDDLLLHFTGGKNIMSIELEQICLFSLKGNFWSTKWNVGLLCYLSKNRFSETPRHLPKRKKISLLIDYQFSPYRCIPRLLKYRNYCSNLSFAIKLYNLSMNRACLSIETFSHRQHTNYVDCPR